MVSTQLDHILLGVPDLETAISEFEQDTGVRPVVGGEHPSYGTSNALVSLSDGVYLELIGPGSSASADNAGGRFARLKTSGLVGFAISAEDLGSMADLARAQGFKARGPSLGSRVTPNGERLEWQVLGIGGHCFGDFVPFLIDWSETPHPSEKAPGGLTISRFEILHSDAGGLARIHRDLLGTDVEIIQADRSMLCLVLETPKGRIAFNGEGPLTFLGNL